MRCFTNLLPVPLFLRHFLGYTQTQCIRENLSRFRLREMDGSRLYERIKLHNNKVKFCFLNSVVDFSPHIAHYPNILETIEDNGDRIVDKPVGSKQLIREINKLGST
jgi:hypothetical protein